jgi:hypothetical protein
MAALLGGCLTTALADSNKMADPKAMNPQIAKAEQMITDADAARKKAASVQGEWRDTGKLIKEAQSALKNGDTVKAMKLAAEAHKQGVLGYQQATSQAQLHMPSYLNY